MSSDQPVMTMVLTLPPSPLRADSGLFRILYLSLYHWVLWTPRVLGVILLQCLFRCPLQDLIWFPTIFVGPIACPYHHVLNEAVASTLSIPTAITNFLNDNAGRTIYFGGEGRVLFASG